LPTPCIIYAKISQKLKNQSILKKYVLAENPSDFQQHKSYKTPWQQAEKP